MRLKNLRHSSIRVDGTRLGKGQSMLIKPNQISGKLQRLIDRGYFRVEVDSKASPEPKENLPDTLPAPPVLPEKVVAVVEEKIPVQTEKVVTEVEEKAEEKPKVIRRRKKRSQPKPAE